MLNYWNDLTPDHVFSVPVFDENAKLLWLYVAFEFED